MTDSNLRELERRFRASGTVEDEAAYLLERLRVGDLEPSKLELAAFVGHAAAVLASGGPGPDLGADREAWAKGLAQFGKEICARAAISAAWLGHEALGLEAPDDALEAAEAWAVCPCRKHEEAAALDPDDAEIRTHLSEEAANVVDALESDEDYGPGFYLECCIQHLTEEEVTRASDRIRDELVPFALGYRDPVRERVEARKSAGDSAAPEFH